MYKCKIFYKLYKGGKLQLAQETITSNRILLINGVYKCWSNNRKCGLGYKNIISIYINNRWCPPIQVAENF